MKSSFLILFCVPLLLWGCQNPHNQSGNHNNDSSRQEGKSSNLKINPIFHASMVLSFDHIPVYVDPIGKPEWYHTFSKPDFILLTHGHPDHYSPQTLAAIVTDSTTIYAPKAVKDKMSANFKDRVVVMNNGDVKRQSGIKIQAVPMYNLRPEAIQFHPKGKGNGYIISDGQERIYISGDTEDTPFMRNLKNIDVAFVCMNLPYTMDVNHAASAVLQFKPKIVYPYHYRGKQGFSDIKKFKRLVNEKDSTIKVKLFNWYPKNKLEQE